jgi:ABC-2 type transport system permease protein
VSGPTTGRLVRTVAFLRKDFFEVLRQPRLLITLVLGPFLILLLFGIGYSPARPGLNAVLVVPPGSGLESRAVELAEALGRRVTLTEVTSDEAAARSSMVSGEADVLVVVPADAAERVRSNEQVPIAIYHSQIDPFESTFINVVAASAVNELNQAILREIVTAGQAESADLEAALPAARSAVESMTLAVERGDPINPADHRALDQSLGDLASTTSHQSGVLGGVDDVAGVDAAGWEALARAQENTDRLGDPTTSNTDLSESLAELESDLAMIEEELATFRDIDAAVMVSPFVAAVEHVQGIDIDFSHYYVPGVIALLLQHLALTFAALSLVRERTLGSVELFRVSPLSAGEALIGKYLAYLLLGGLVSAALTGAAIVGFGFQIAGSLGWFAFMIFLVLVASLGGGFVISAIARTESEAIQYAMIALMISIFFSGFFISTDRLIEAVRVVSFLQPATYGIAALQDIAFRGQAPEPLIVAGATGVAVVFLVSAWLLMRERVVPAGKPSSAPNRTPRARRLATTR